METKQIVAALESGSLEDPKTVEAMAEAAKLIVAQQDRIRDLTALRAHDEKLLAPLQAKIDALMLEYCPEEMTTEQLENWKRHQQRTDAIEKGGE